MSRNPETDFYAMIERLSGAGKPTTQQGRVIDFMMNEFPLCGWTVRVTAPNGDVMFDLEAKLNDPS